MGTAILAERRGVSLGSTRKHSEERNRSRQFICSVFSLFLFLAFFAGASLGQDLNSLAKQLKDGDTEQKRSTLMAIRGLRSAEASRIAVPALRDGNEMVRATATASVIFLPPEEGFDALIPLLSDKSPFVRKEAAYAIGKVGESVTVVGDPSEDRVASALRTVLQRDKDPEVRAAAAIGMGGAGGLKSVFYLYFYLQQSQRGETEEFIRRSAVKSIGRMAESIRSGKRTVVSLKPGSTQDLSKADLTKAIRAFSPAAELIRQILQNTSESDDIRREAAKALGSIGDVSAVSSLTAALNSKDPYLVENSRDALARLKAVE
jgi:HEAT repeat protein